MVCRVWQAGSLLHCPSPFQLRSPGQDNAADLRAIELSFGSDSSAAINRETETRPLFEHHQVFTATRGDRLLKSASKLKGVFPVGDVAKVSGALTFGGTLIVTNIGSTALTNGDSFKLFNAASYGGAFASVQLPPLPAGLAWNTGALNTGGILSVIVKPHPVIGSAKILSSGLIFNGSSGVGYANYYLLGSTNLSAPVANWTRLLTNQFDAAGGFNFTNAVDGNLPCCFYLLQAP
jgi:hypothetical protein